MNEKKKSCAKVKQGLPYERQHDCIRRTHLQECQGHRQGANLNPAEIQRRIGIARGDELILVAKGRRTVLEEPARVVELLKDEFADLETINEESLKKLGLNKTDDVWDQYHLQAKD